MLLHTPKVQTAGPQQVSKEGTRSLQPLHSAREQHAKRLLALTSLGQGIWKKSTFPTLLKNHLWASLGPHFLQKNIHFFFIDYAKPFDCVDHNKLWKILKEMAPGHLTWPWEKQQLETDMEQQTGSKLGKEHVKAVYCHPAYLTDTQSTPCEMPGWMTHKLESRLPGEIWRASAM